MEKAIVQTLHGLVPTLSDPLPAELVNLSSSLLAQSYGRASNLKADEEIARSYACAHIACNRCEAPDLVEASLFGLSTCS